MGRVRRPYSASLYRPAVFCISYAGAGASLYPAGRQPVYSVGMRLVKGGCF